MTTEVNDDFKVNDEVNDGNTTEVDSDDSEYDPSTEEEEEQESDCLSVEETLQLQKRLCFSYSTIFRSGTEADRD